MPGKNISSSSFRRLVGGLGWPTIVIFDGSILLIVLLSFAFLPISYSIEVGTSHGSLSFDLCYHQPVTWALTRDDQLTGEDTLPHQLTPTTSMFQPPWSGLIVDIFNIFCLLLSPWNGLTINIFNLFFLLSSKM